MLVKIATPEQIRELRELRESLSVTQEECARAIGLADSSLYSKREKGTYRFTKYEYDIISNYLRRIATNKGGGEMEFEYIQKMRPDIFSLLKAAEEAYKGGHKDLGDQILEREVGSRSSDPQDRAVNDDK
jgi:transcriptional regulator with XRE-family HTH domain